MNKSQKTIKAWGIIKDGKILSLKPTYIPMGAEVMLIFSKKNRYTRFTRDNENGKFQRVEIKLLK